MCFAVCWELKFCLAIFYKLKREEKGWNFGNIASISQTHLFHIFYIHISLSTHTSGSIAKPVAFYWFVTIVWSFKLHFWKCFKTKKVGKMAKIWKNRASLSSHNISQNLHRYFTVYGIYPASKLLVLGLELLFKAFCHSSTVLEAHVKKHPRNQTTNFRRWSWWWCGMTAINVVNSNVLEVHFCAPDCSMHAWYWARGRHWQNTE